MKIQEKFQKWGNSLGLRLSDPMKSIPHFEENMLVTVTEQGIRVHPVKKNTIKKLPFTERQLLKGLSPETSHARELACGVRNLNYAAIGS